MPNLAHTLKPLTTILKNAVKLAFTSEMKQMYVAWLTLPYNRSSCQTGGVRKICPQFPTIRMPQKRGLAAKWKKSEKTQQVRPSCIFESNYFLEREQVVGHGTRGRSNFPAQHGHCVECKTLRVVFESLHSPFTSSRVEPGMFCRCTFPPHVCVHFGSIA